MSVSPHFSGKVCFAEFELDLATGELRSNGARTTLPGQPFQILVALLNRPGQLVTREELKRQLWPSETFVDFDVSLNKAVNRLREALDDSADHPRFIETLPRRGYRFKGTVEKANSTDVASPATETLFTEQPGEREHVPPDPPKSEPLSRKKIIWKTWGKSGSRYGLLGIAASLVVAVALLAIFNRTRRSGDLDLARVRFIKLTDNGRVQDVAISPDGRYVVYSLTDRRQESLYLSQVATGSQVQILPPGPGFHGPTFSPNGDYVYFVRSDPDDPFFKYLYSMPVLGGAARRMISDVDSPVSFSPDGRQFVFERGVLARSLIELRVANADGSGEHALAQIPNGDSGLFQPGPSWSPDGRTIMVPVRFGDLIPERKWVLESVSTADGRVREIYSSPVPLGRPVWLSGGSLFGKELNGLIMPRHFFMGLKTVMEHAGAIRRS